MTDIINNKYGKLLVLSKNTNNANKRKPEYWCLCDCSVIKSIRKDKLLDGRTVSCGNCNAKGFNTRVNNRPIFNRDNYICQKCNNTSLILNAHHIYDASTYPKLRLAECNLITLCKECHDNFHKIYPINGSNTLTDLEQYLNRDYKYRNELIDLYYKEMETNGKNN